MLPESPIDVAASMWSVLVTRGDVARRDHDVVQLMLSLAVST